MHIMTQLLSFPPRKDEKDKEYFARLADLVAYEGDSESLRAKVRYHLKKKGYRQSMNGVLDYIEDKVGPAPEKTEVEMSADRLHYRYDGTESIMTEEQAVRFFQVDTTKWKFEKLEHKSWDVHMKLRNWSEAGKVVKEQAVKRVNYYTSVSFTPRRDALQKEIASKLSELVVPSEIVHSPKDEGECVLAISDIHTGANVKRTPILKQYSVQDVIYSFNRIAERAGRYGSVRLVILGDLIESFTGTNHPNSWKEIEGYGVQAVISFFEILCTHLIDKIPGLASIDLVSGNHDRVTSSSSEDTSGEVVSMIDYLIRLKYPKINVSYDPILLVKDYHDVRYIFMHGHLKFAQKSPADIVAMYGWNKYNVILHGHLHKRQTTGAITARLNTYEEIKMVDFDSSKFIKICISPIFTGNSWSVGQFGGSSVAGFSIIEPSTGGINHLSYSI